MSGGRVHSIDRSMSQWQQREQAKALLAKEVGYVRKPHAGRLRVALAFPNTYFVGMSNLGFQTVYRLFNAEDGYRLRARVPAAQERDRGAEDVGCVARHGRIADARPRLRHPGVLGVVRVGLRQRAHDAAAGRHPRPCRAAHPSRPAGDDRRRGHLREPGAAGAVCRRDCRRRRRGADPAAARSLQGSVGPRRPAAAAGAGARLLRAVVLRRALSRVGLHRALRAEGRHRRAGGRAQGGAQDHRSRRSAGHVDLHARHRVRLALPRRGGARLRQPVPVLLGGLQLPAGARVSRRSASCELAAGRAALFGSRRPGVDRACAITRTSRRSSRAWRPWATASVRRRCGSTT